MLNTQHLGSYVLAEQLHEHPTGTVYRGVHATSNEPVTITILPEKYGKDPDRVARFNRTVEAVRRIQHPVIARILEHGESPQGLYLVTESLTGERLAERLKREPQLPLAETQRIVGAVAGALAAAHRKRLVHRGLTADSIFLVEGEAGGGSPAVKLLDLGLATLLADPAVPGGNGAVRRKGLDVRADIQALGRLAYQMLAGEAPGPSNTDPANSQDGGGRPARLSARGVSVPGSVEAAIMRSLERKKKRRFSSMAEFARAMGVEIETVQATEVQPAEMQPAEVPAPESEIEVTLEEADLAPVERPRPPPLPVRSRPPSPTDLLSRVREVARTARRHPRALAVAGAAAVALLAAGGFLLRAGGGPGPAARRADPQPAAIDVARTAAVARPAPAPAASAPTRVDEVLALNGKAVSAYQRGDIKTARSLLLQADRLAVASGYKDAPVRAQTQVRLGALSAAQKKTRLARRYLVRAVAINPAVRIPPEMMSPRVYKTLIATKQKARLAKNGRPQRGLKNQPVRRHGRDLRKG